MSRRFVNLPAILSLVFVIFSLSSLFVGCGGNPTPRRFFSLAPEAPQPNRVSAPPTIRVREINCAPPYDQTGIIFRVSPVEIRSYRYQDWSSTPGIMVTEVLRRYIASTGLFILVDEEDPADLELGGRVDAIEQVVREDQWFGRLEISMTLRRTRDGRVFWRRRIDGSLPAEERDVAEVVAAQSRILGDALQEAMPSLYQAAVLAVVGPPAGTREETTDRDSDEPSD